jgi:transcriptional regulator with XRE-family HTH domain
MGRARGGPDGGAAGCWLGGAARSGTVCDDARVAKTSNRRFGDALRELMKAQGLTYRSLAAATRDRDGKGVTHAHINMLANGHDKPTMRTMELIADAVGVAPEYFAEYRLAVAMRQLDPTAVGLEQALANLDVSLAARRTVAARRPPARAPRARPHPSG